MLGVADALLNLVKFSHHPVKIVIDAFFLLVDLVLE